MEAKGTKDDHILEVHDGYVTWDMIYKRAAERSLQAKEFRENLENSKEEVKDNGQMGK